jgi:hypothetical protein
MADRRYLKPPWMQRNVGNRLAPLFRPSLVQKLSVPGRRSGRWHTLPIVVLEHNGKRYLISYRGESDWVLDLRASRTGRLIQRGRVEEIRVVEVPIADRAPLIEAYTARYGKMPNGRRNAPCPARPGRSSDIPHHRVRRGAPSGEHHRLAPSVGRR